MYIHFKLIGTLLILLALIHIGFPKYFNWQKELQTTSLMTKQLLGVHTFFIALTVLLMGILCLTSYQELASTPLGQTITLGLGTFWLIRLLFQLFVYSPKLWKGKTFETTMHVVFIIFWTYLSSIFLLTYYLQGQ